MCSEIKNSKYRAIGILHVKFVLLAVCFCFLSPVVFSVKNDNKRVIVIDAGHGGKDPGSHGSKCLEKDITLAIALKTGEYIKQKMDNVKVIYTRVDDSFPELRERPKIANQNKADLFISIHANAVQDKRAYGTETFVMGYSKNKQNLAVAMKENSVILLEDDYSTKYEGFDPNSPESYIMFTLMQNIYQEQSINLASKIQTQFRERVGRTDRGVKQAGLWVLYNTTMPSVLVETGFITNPAEEKFLMSNTGQDYIASAIFRACRDYLNDIDSKSGISAVTKEENNLNADLDNLFFMVQIATTSSKSEIKPENFNGLTDITELKTDEHFKYASGKFSEYSTAAMHRKKLESIYPDAFVIAVKNNEIMPLQQALEQKNRK